MSLLPRIPIPEPERWTARRCVLNGHLWYARAHEPNARCPIDSSEPV